MNYDYIDRRLKEIGISRRQLAIKAGVSENTISGAFRRKSKNLSHEIVLKIARVLDVPWIALYNEGELDLPYGDYVIAQSVWKGDNDKILTEAYNNGKDASRLAEINQLWNELNETGKNKLYEYVGDLTWNPQYMKRQLFPVKYVEVKNDGSETK